MKKKKTDQSQVDELRRRAEERLEYKNHLAAEISPSEANKLIHELRVHQIELEMQNDELRQAQEIIEKSHSRYIDLYDFAPIGYLTLDRLGFIKEANLTAARQLQVERTRLIDSHFTHFMFPDDRKAFRRHLSLVLEGEERQAIELRLKIRDGAELFALLESACYRDITGIKLCRTAFTDITWRRRTEVALKESEEFYRSIFQNNHVMMLLIDPATGDIVDANPAACAFYGSSCEELRSRKITDINTLPDEQVFAEMQLAKEGRRRQFSCRHRLPRGEGRFEVRDVEVFSSPMRFQGREMLYSIINDISARKEAERSLQRAKEELQIILDSVPAMIFYKDKENRFIRTNRALSEATGLAKEEMDGKFLFELFPSLADYYWKDDQEVMRGGIPKRNIVETLQTPEGIRWVQTDKIPYSDNEGNIIGEIGFMRDITELKLAEEALKRVHDELEERVEERTEDLRRTVEQLQWEITERWRAEEALTESEQRLRYLATQLLSAQERERQRISMELHDGLGQSLMVLKMQIGAVKRNLPSELKGARDGCSDAVDTLNSIIDDIHRISHNLSASILEDMDLSAALKQLFEEFSMGHEIECSVNFDDIANLFSPETELIIYRIFQEALTNIGKYAQATKVMTTIKKTEKGIHFSVKDNGNGFDIEHVLAGTATRRGIGLGSMEERVRMINGIYRLWSEVGKGTKISFILPINISKSKPLAKKEYIIR